MEPQIKRDRDQARYIGESETLSRYPERMDEPVAVVSYGLVDGEMIVNRVGAFRSGQELQKYLQDAAEQTGGFLEGFTIRTGATEITYKAIPLGVALDLAGAEAPVAIFKKDEISGEPEAIGVYRSAEEFSGLLDFGKEHFLGKDASLFSAGDDVAVSHQRLEKKGYIAVSTGEFVR